jgi:four helix bundle protein
MSNGSGDLEKRTFQFAQSVRTLTRKLPPTIENRQDSIQLVKASGSVGANYIEAKEAVSEKDYFYRVKVCKKEARESTYWLELLDCDENDELDSLRKHLVDESVELSKIFWAIARKEKT